MERSAVEIRAAALALPAEARATIADGPIRSLDDAVDDAVDDDAEAAWSAEIVRRIEVLDRGQTRLVPWSEVRRAWRTG
jgi:hypothetical protein